MELLDDYLRNKLSAQDRSAFEEILKNDAFLQKEMRMQEQVVSHLRSARVSELKQMLNNVPVTGLATEGTSVAAKVAAWLVAAGLAGGGLFLYFNSEYQSTEAISGDTPALAPVTTPADKPAAPAEENLQPPVVAQDVTDEEQPKVSTSATDAVATEKTADSVAPSVRDVFVPEESKPAETAAAPDTGKGTAGVVSTPSIDIEAGINGNNGKYNFHYQFKDNKLFLYGVFEKNLYELLEFFSNNKRTLFLYYKDNYYLLNEDDSKVKRLAPINDQALLKKLKDYRAAR